MKFESFKLSDLCIKGEGNLHVVVLNIKTGHVFRFPKEVRKENEVPSETVFEAAEANKVYKIQVNYKKYNVIQKFWGKDYLPKTRVCLFPKQIIELIAAYLEDQRLESRKIKSIITQTSYIEVQPDLSRLPIEYNCFTSGSTFCIELKPKFGILFQTNNNCQDCRSKASRFCLSQQKKLVPNRTDYCPCDMFSGNHKRMTRSIKSLIESSQEKLRIFQDGHISSVIDNRLICNLVEHLFQQEHIEEEEALGRFCDLIIQALTYDVSEKRNLLKLPFDVSTNCLAHSWSDQNNNDYSPGIPKIFYGSVLGKLISTSCLVSKRSEEMEALYNKLQRFLVEKNIEMIENIFDLWNEYLLPLDLPEDIREIVRILKKYLVSLTVRDCSIMIKFKRASVDKLIVKHSNSAILKQGNGSNILCMTDVVDISIKPISKIKFNSEYEQELMGLFQ